MLFNICQNCTNLQFSRCFYADPQMPASPFSMPLTRPESWISYFLSLPLLQARGKCSAAVVCSTTIKTSFAQGSLQRTQISCFLHPLWNCISRFIFLPLFHCHNKLFEILWVKLNFICHVCPLHLATSTWNLFTVLMLPTRPSFRSSTKLRKAMSKSWRI